MCVCSLGLTKRHTRDRSDASPAHTYTRGGAGEGINGMILTNWIPPFDRFFLFVPPARGSSNEKKQKINDTDVRARQCLGAPLTAAVYVYLYLYHTHIFGIICVAEPRPMCSTCSARAQYALYIKYIILCLPRRHNCVKMTSPLMRCAAHRVRLHSLVGVAASRTYRQMRPGKYFQNSGEKKNVYWIIPT